MTLPSGLDKLILIRHCSTSLNEASLIIGASDPPLSRLGIEQLQELKVWFIEQELTGTRVLSSDLQRCLQTSRELSNNIQDSRHLRERFLGKYEGLSADELITVKEAIDYSTEDASLIWEGIEGVESDREVYKRFSDYLHRVLNPNIKEMVVVSHAGLLKAVVHHLLDIPTDRPYAIKFGLGCGIVLGRRGARFELHKLWENPKAKVRVTKW